LNPTYSVQSLLMRRHLFASVSALSLVLCVASCVLWARSRTSFDEFTLITWDAGSRWYSQRGFRWDEGEFVGWYTAGTLAEGKTWAGLHLPSPGWKHVVSLNPYVHERWWAVWMDWPGRGLGAGQKKWDRRAAGVFQIWSASLLTAVLPITWVVGRIARRRADRHGLCRRCDYDLRATSDRCPECGTVPGAKSAAIQTR
jgi:hypothetical protein